MLRLNLLLLVSVLLSGLYLVETQYESRRLFTELHRATNEARNLETEYQRLQVELRAQSSPSRIESLAVAQGLQGASPAITHYVRDEQPALEPAPRFVGNRREGRGVGDHRVADAGQLLDEGRNRHARRDQLLPLADAAVRVDLDDADFRDAVDGGSGAGGFEVDEGEGKHDRTGSGGGGG